ncbi:hypothetical protein JCM9140_3598 [Halalkalibacter wakoensis JCM 9140]|uniref:SLH domain-containing protein n=1 Tax=Halalkalibacter wakoensis JCM 9140 TaxID=1236970 RepID=W4Q5W7_9BACI|nr:carboxypeptidase regulatory-like domain-containing protein [Halalkalibacter wakoensis]GAE27451.1 hypothetical protein JCM9140_3598 [Halalkalibacter wakoensis JCM 9140]
MSYQPRSYRKFLATSVTAAAVVATSVAATPANVSANVMFSDVAADYFAADEINALVEKEIISGYPDGTFKPGQSINRGQAASILVKAAGLEVPSAIDAAPFSDVSSVNNFAPVLTVMKDAGFIGGYPDGTYRAGNNITREQMASILVNTFGLEDTGEKVTITDLESAHASHQDNIIKLAQAGITNVEQFRPKESVTRAQFATFVYRALELQVETDEQIVESAATAITGFVRNGDTGIEGVTVTVGGKSVVTDKEGFYQVAGLAAGEQDVTFSKTGYQPKTKKATLIEDEAVSLFVSELTQLNQEEITVKANVVDAVTGASVTTADVVVSKFNQSTEEFEELNLGEDFSFENGEISITNTEKAVNFGDKLRLQVSRDYASNSKNALHPSELIDFTLHADAASNILSGIEMSKVEAMTLSGVLKDANDVVLADADVEIHNEDGEFETVKTNASGEYSFDDITVPSGSYSIKVDSADNALYLGQVTITEGQDATHDVNLVQANELAFTVQAQGVNEVLRTEGLQAELVQNGAVISTSVINGSKFAFDRIPAGDYTVRVTGDYVLPASFAVTVNDQEAPNTAGDRLTTAGVVEVTAEEGATVRLLQDGEVKAETRERNDSDAYTFTSVAAGDYQVQVSKSGKVTKTVDVAVTKNNSSDKDVELVDVEDSANVSGVVRAEGTLAQATAGSVSYYAVSVEDKEVGELVETTTIQGNGQYETVNVAPGVYQVVVRADGFETKVASLTVAAGDNIQNRNYEVTTGGNASLALSFVDENGDEVEVAAEDVLFADSYAGVKTAAESETVSFANLSAGTYSLEVAKQDGKQAYSTSVTIAKGEEKEFEVVLLDEVEERTSSVNMLVLNENNANATGFVAAFDTEGKLVQVVSLTNGTAALNLGNGSYDVRIFVDGYKVVKNEVVVDKKDVTIPVIQLKK